MSSFIHKSSFDSLARAGWRHLFASAIPLLLDAGTFACCVSALGQYAPHYRTRRVLHSCITAMLTLSLATRCGRWMVAPPAVGVCEVRPHVMRTTVRTYLCEYRTRHVSNSSITAMSTLSLARTPDRHRQPPTSGGPELRPFASSARK